MKHRTEERKGLKKAEQGRARAGGLARLECRRECRPPPPRAQGLLLLWITPNSSRSSHFCCKLKEFVTTSLETKSGKNIEKKNLKQVTRKAQIRPHVTISSARAEQKILNKILVLNCPVGLAPQPNFPQIFCLRFLFSSGSKNSDIWADLGLVDYSF